MNRRGLHHPAPSVRHLSLFQKEEENAIFNQDASQIGASLLSDGSAGSSRRRDHHLGHPHSDTSVPHHSLPNHNHNHKRPKSGWYAQWKAQRDAKVVQTSRDMVNAYVDAVVQSSHFIQATPDQPIPRFLRGEVVHGKLLGSGILARVFDIKDLDLTEHLLWDDEASNSEDEYNDLMGDTISRGGSSRLSMNHSSIHHNNNNTMNTSDRHPILDLSMSSQRSRLQHELQEIEELSQQLQDDSVRLQQQQQQQLATLYEAGHSEEHARELLVEEHDQQQQPSSKATRDMEVPPFHAFPIQAISGRSIRSADDGTQPLGSKSVRFGNGATAHHHPPDDAVQDDHRTLETLSTRIQDPAQEQAPTPVAPVMTATMPSKLQILQKQKELEAATTKLGSNIVRLVETNMKDNPATASFRVPPPSRICLLLEDMADSQRQLVERKAELEASLLRVEARDWLRSKDQPLALKHLTKHLLRDPKSFYLAAAALLIEAKYLSKMSHPNIVQIKGLPMMAGGDEEGIQSGKYDAYFFMMPRLTDVLERRIRQWRKEAGMALLVAGGRRAAGSIKTHSPLSEKTPSEKIQTWQWMKRKTNYALQMANAMKYLHDRNLLYRDLKPMNIGFIGDNHTIQIYNFGCCRELDPVTGKVTTDEVSDFVSSLTHRYTAPECFPKEHHHRSSSSSVSLSSLSWTNRRGSKKKGRSSGSTKSSKSNNNRSSSVVQFLPEEVLDVDEKPSYDERVDVYSWAMVYYELLTLEQPYAQMSIQEFKKSVCGVYTSKPNIYLEGAKRPGVYQHDLLPSMISLLQRAWEQQPSKRPSMESICNNLVTITHELEYLIKAAQRALMLEAKEMNSDSRESLVKTTSYEGSARNATAPVAAPVKKQVASTQQDLQQKGKKLLVTVKRAPGLAASAFSTDPSAKSNGDAIPSPETLEYENWDRQSSSDSESESDASSITDDLGYTPDTHDNPLPSTLEDVEEEDGEEEELNDEDVVGSAVSNLKNKKTGNQQSTSRGRRKLQSLAPTERRVTNRMSRRTISGLSRASLLFVQWDRKTAAKLVGALVLVLVALIWGLRSLWQSTQGGAMVPSSSEDVNWEDPFAVSDQCQQQKPSLSPPKPGLFKIYVPGEGLVADSSEHDNMSNEMEPENQPRRHACGFLKLSHCVNLKKTTSF